MFASLSGRNGTAIAGVSSASLPAGGSFSQALPIPLRRSCFTSALPRAARGRERAAAPPQASRPRARRSSRRRSRARPVPAGARRGAGRPPRPLPSPRPPRRRSGSYGFSSAFFLARGFGFGFGFGFVAVRGGFGFSSSPRPRRQLLRSYKTRPTVGSERVVPATPPAPSETRKTLPSRRGTYSWTRAAGESPSGFSASAARSSSKAE